MTRQTVISEERGCNITPFPSLWLSRNLRRTKRIEKKKKKNRMVNVLVDSI